MKLKIDIKMCKDFEVCLDELKRKYGEDFEYLNGIHESQTNFSDFIDAIANKNISDVTIDSNANASNKDIVSVLSEKGKSIDKLFSFNKIFYEIRKKYGLKTAREWLESEYVGAFYLHDAPSASLKGYCYAFDITRLATEGLFFLDHYNNEPPKHLTTFFDDVIESVSYFSNRSSGAVGLPNVLIWSYYFWVHDVKNKYYINDPEYYLKQNFQKFIYRLNQPFMRVDQSAFVNVSIFDREYLHGLFDGVIYPDGSMVVDNIEEIIEHQKIFMEVVSEIRQQNLFTFPVLTYSLLYKNGKFVDEDFARWCSDHNVTWNDSNFFIGDNVGVLSNCCFSGDQMCLTKSSDGVNYMTFKELFEAPYNETKRNFAIFHNGSWVKGKLITLPKRDMYKITTSNKKEVYVTDNHIFPTLRGDVVVADLTLNDYLMFNCRRLDAENEQNEHLSYEQGYLIGMYLGDGSCYQKTENHTPVIRLSLNQSKYNNTLSIIQKAIEQIDSQADYVLHKPCNNGYPTAITSWGVTNFIKKYVIGSHANEKELNMDCLLQSYDFRKGILDGYYMTDGGNSHRIYTTSKKLAYQTECLITSLGMNSVINTTDRTDEPVVIRGNMYKRNYPLYCIKWYSPMNNRAHNGSGFKCVNNSEYYKISSIEKIDYDDDYVYCFEMKNEEEPYFTLPNGIITHNCRLLSDTRKLDAFINSIGGTALSIGSIKVNTINLVRIFYEAGADEEKYLNLLRKRVILCCKTLDRVRHIIKRNIEKGLLPNFQDGGVELDKCYNTVGIIGLYEVIRNFGYTQTDEFGYVSYTDKGIEFAEKIFNIINDTKDNFTDEYSINVESVPAERAAIILCAKDRALYELDNDDFIYANQWIPLMTKCSFKEKLRLSSILDRKCGGGVISHINLESNFPNTDTAWEMLNRIAAAGVIYFAFNNRINECRNHHGFVGTDICPTCGEPVYDTYSRIVGFLVPTRAYSKDRYKEFNVRQWYTEAELRSE